MVDPKVNRSWESNKGTAVPYSYQLSMVVVKIVKGTIDRAAKSQVELRRSHNSTVPWGWKDLLN